MTTLLLSSLVYGCGGSVAGSAQDGGQNDQTSNDQTSEDAPSDADAAADALGDASVGDGAEDAPLTLDAPMSDSADAAQDGPWSIVCPDNQPMPGNSCDAGTICEYNEAWWSITCSLALECIAGQWTQSPACNGPCVPAPGPNDPQCPASPMGITQASPCPDAGLTCNWYQGITCDCHEAIIGDPDAGTQWLCEPGPGCPPTRPRLGAPCGPNQLGCQYAALAMQCTNGVWTAGPNCGR